MPAFLKVGGQWKPIVPTRIKFNGSWRDVSNAWVKVANTWRQYIVTSAAPVAFDPTKKHTNATLTDSNLAITNQQINWGVVVWGYLNEARISGKLYYEFKMTNLAGAASDKASVGIAPGTVFINSPLAVGVTFHANTGIYLNGTLQTTHSGGWVTNDVIQICIDYDAGKVWLGKNNVFSGSPAAGTGGVAYAASGKFVGAAVFCTDDTITRKVTANLKTSNQTYAPPSGFTAAGGA
jgi:hypothetical protein